MAVTVLDATSVSRSMETFTSGGGDHQQTVREVRATAAAAATSWTVTTAGSASVIAADTTRVYVGIESQGAGRVYVNFNSTIPTATVHHLYLDSGDRYEVPWVLSYLAISAVGASAGGFVLFTLATAT